MKDIHKNQLNDIDDFNENENEYCDICNNKLIFNTKYNCYYCKNCNEFEDKCDSPLCDVCRNRPKKPLI